jgi:hypothetical protein
MDVSLNSHHVLESVLLIISVGPGELNNSLFVVNMKGVHIKIMT